jgi:2-dehydro-3-deoxyphosphooctonate aldolase (KDO 8-P synthase)
MTSSDRFLLLSGPCVIESLEGCQTIAPALTALGRDRPELEIVFKASFDKANRTSISSFGSHSVDAGLDVLARIREEFRSR